MKKLGLVLIVFMIVFTPESSFAKVKLPAIFTNNMVLQQQSDVLLWGEATPKKTLKITTSWNNKTYQLFVASDGKWKTTVTTPVYGGPYSVEISDGTKIVLTNVMIGEVWVCSGQSNMEFPVSGNLKVLNNEQEVASANYPNIRLYHIKKSNNTKPLDDTDIINEGWQPCTPKTIPDFSAVGYFFGRDLYQKMNIPIGLIETSWGGTPAEAWTSAPSLQTMPDYTNTAFDMTNFTPIDEQLKKYKQDMIAWNQAVVKSDIGFSNGKALWADKNLNDKDWKTMKIPDNWDNQGLSTFDGVIWLRKTIDIPAEWQNRSLKLALDVIDDDDITYFNGVEVGKTEGYTMVRNYSIPANLVKSGKAVITVRVFDSFGGGGIYGNPNSIKLILSPEKSISLVGDWLYNIGFKTNELPQPSMLNGANRPTVLFNAMIHPIIQYKIRGAIWYQGEANASKAYQYRELFPLMIKDWRKQWNDNFPFYFVQLANYTARLTQPAEADWAELREAQLQTLHLENTGMAVTIDIGEANDIHPKNKQEVGRRLSLIASAKTYGEKVPYSGPIYDSYTIEGNTIRIKFTHTDGGLKSKNGDPLIGFAIAGLDHIFHWADARIEGTDVIVTCKDVINPISVRYAWAKNPVCNLYNGVDLPASPFRTDDWQGITYGKK